MQMITDIEWLDEYGFAIARNVQSDGSYGELCLVRLIMEDDEIVHANHFLDSKHLPRLMARYKRELLNPQNEIIMDIRETLKGLGIRQLKSLLPSYYQLAIEARIAELEANKRKKNATPKVKRNTKKATQVKHRSRVVQA
jgi:hypothetical protein